MRCVLALIGSCILSAVLCGPAVAQQSFQQLFKKLQESTGTSTQTLPNSQVAKGLKEALQVGTDKAVSRTGRQDGYFGNALIKILMPEKLRTVEKGLRFVGYGDKVDEFILSMNRAAERAAPKAKEIFIDAILSMSFDDARQILEGGDTAATDFFKRKTSENLYGAFRPVVDNTMNQVGTVQRYNALLGQARQLPFVKDESLDVGDYVTNKALDGLFLIVAEEERQIRQNPAARITPLLQQVFGH